MLYNRAVAAATASAITLVLVSGSVISAAPAFAGTPHAYYVNNTSSACTDSGSGSAAAPFCTVQAAFNKVAAGDLVDLVAGTYTSPTTLTASGTSSAPITVMFSGSRSQCYNGSGPIISLPVGSTRPALTISNAAYVDVESPCAGGGSTAAAIAVQNSTQVMVQGGFIESKGDGIAISGSGVGDAVERMVVTSQSTGVAVSSAADVTITTNQINAFSTAAVGITVSGSTDTDIVSNTIVPECAAGVSVGGGSSATAMENNVIGINPATAVSCGAATPVGLSVAADSASEFAENYDSIGMPTGVPVKWAGTDYQSQSAFNTATAQGAKDYVGTDDVMSDSHLQDFVDAADALANGELSADLNDNPRVDDPNIANTGTGVGYYDRGANEVQSPVNGYLKTVDPSGGHGITVTSYPVAPCGTWGSTYTATLLWGDGQSTIQTGKSCNGEFVSATHKYAYPGTYGLTFTVTDGHSTETTTESATPAGLNYASYGPTRILDTRNGTGAAKAKIGPGGFARVKVAGNGSIPGNVKAVALNLTATNVAASGYVAAVADGSGAPSTSNLNFSSGQTVANSAIVQVPADGYIDVYNGSKASSIDVLADVTGYFSPTASAGYNALTPDRILDTRNGTGAAKAQVAANSGISVGIVGVDSIPASATAVAVHVTVANAHGGGFVAAVPDGSGTPTTSSVNFSAGVTTSNTVIVPIAADGKIKLYNGASGAVDLIADVAGYFTAASTNVYVPQTPSRVLDTRYTSSPLKSDTAYYYSVSTNSDPGIVAVAANLTATQPTAGGNLQAYPAGTTRPGASNVNFGPGQTVANLALLTNSASTGADTDVYNDSLGTTQLIIDVFGYYTSN